MTPEMEALRDTYIDATSKGLARTRAEMDELQTALLQAETVELAARVALTESMEAAASS